MSVTIEAAPRLLRVAEVAERLQLNKSYVYGLLRDGTIPGQVKIGQAVRVDAESFEQWFAELRKDGKVG